MIYLKVGKQNLVFPVCCCCMLWIYHFKKFSCTSWNQSWVVWCANHCVCFTLIAIIQITKVIKAIRGLPSLPLQPEILCNHYICMFLLLYNDLSVCRNDSLFQDPRQWGKQTWEKLHKNCMGGWGVRSSGPCRHRFQYLIPVFQLLRYPGYDWSILWQFTSALTCTSSSGFTRAESSTDMLNAWNPPLPHLLTFWHFWHKKRFFRKWGARR